MRWIAPEGYYNTAAGTRQDARGRRGRRPGRRVCKYAQDNMLARALTTSPPPRSGGHEAPREGPRVVDHGRAAVARGRTPAHRTLPPLALVPRMHRPRPRLPSPPSTPTNPRRVDTSTHPRWRPRNDADVHGKVDLSDALHALLVLFADSATDCRYSVDANHAGTTDVADAAYVLSCLSANELARLPPFPARRRSAPSS